MARTPSQMANQLRKLGSPGVQRRIGAALFVAGNAVQVDAQISITTGAVSGAKHIASLPGEAPNADTGVLANNIETLLIRDTGSDLKVEVTSSAPYSEALEFGTKKMAARPFMAPAANKNRKKATAFVKRAMNKAIRDKL